MDVQEFIESMYKAREKVLLDFCLDLKLDIKKLSKRGCWKRYTNNPEVEIFCLDDVPLFETELMIKNGTVRWEIKPVQETI